MLGLSSVLFYRQSHRFITPQCPFSTLLGLLAFRIKYFFPLIWLITLFFIFYSCMYAVKRSAVLGIENIILSFVPMFCCSAPMSWMQLLL